MKIISKEKALLTNAVRMADDHRKNCEGATCNISLSLLLEVLRLAKVEVPKNLIERFM